MKDKILGLLDLIEYGLVPQKIEGRWYLVRIEPTKEDGAISVNAYLIFSMKIGFAFETFEDCIEAGLEAIKVLSKPDTKVIDLGQ